MTVQKQVNKAHYDFNKYVDLYHWNSFFYQIDEIIKTTPKSILEVGLGTGIVKYILKDVLHYNYESMDIDPELNPDHVGSILAMPFRDKQYDVVGCFEVLEHLHYCDFEKALSELFRVANKAVIFSLPDAGPIVPVHISGFARKKLIKMPFTKLKKHVFDGEHYWEINKRGYELNKIISQIKNIGGNFNFVLDKEYRMFENPNHHFFVMKNCTLWQKNE